MAMSPIDGLLPPVAIIGAGVEVLELRRRLLPTPREGERDRSVERGPVVPTTLPDEAPGGRVQAGAAAPARWGGGPAAPRPGRTRDLAAASRSGKRCRRSSIRSAAIVASRRAS